MATQPRLTVPAQATENETAHQLFLQQVRLLPGVVRIEQFEDQVTSSPSFRIYVRDGDREAQYAVYELEAEVYRLHHGTYLDVLVVQDTNAGGANGDAPVAAG